MRSGDPIPFKNITRYLPHLVEPNCSISFQYPQGPTASVHKLRHHMRIKERDH